MDPEGRSRPQTLGGQATQRIAIRVGGRLTSKTSAYRQYPPPAKPPGESGASSSGPRHLMGPASVGSGGHLPTAGGARKRSGPKEPAVCHQSRRASDLKTPACKQNPPAPKAPGGSGRKPRERTAASKEPQRTSKGGRQPRGPRALGGYRQQPARHQSPRASDLKNLGLRQEPKAAEPPGTPGHPPIANLARREGRPAGTPGTRGASVGTLAPSPRSCEPPPLATVCLDGASRRSCSEPGRPAPVVGVRRLDDRHNAAGIAEVCRRPVAELGHVTSRHFGCPDVLGVLERVDLKKDFLPASFKKVSGNEEFSSITELCQALAK